jgi:hypothetical protein
MKQLTLVLVMLISIAANANNLQITNVTSNVSGNTTTVSFDVSWENSWRGGPAGNYDAAWLFIKYKDNAGEWHHLNLTGANNSAAAPLSIDAPSDKKGIFVYRTADGIGNIAPTTVTVGVVQQAGSFDIKVFGLEMVYIPQGVIILGGANGNGYFEGGTGGVFLHLISLLQPPCYGERSW